MGLLFRFVRNRLVLDGFRLAVQFSCGLILQPCLLGQCCLSLYSFLVGFHVLTYLPDLSVVPVRPEEVLKFYKLFGCSLSFHLDITIFQIIIDLHVICPHRKIESHGQNHDCREHHGKTPKDVRGFYAQAEMMVDVACLDGILSDCVIGLTKQVFHFLLILPLFITHFRQDLSKSFL